MLPALLLLRSATAEAFTTRVHIVIANDVRESLIAGDGRTIALKAPIHGQTFRVQLSEADAKAIVRQPLAFRAGAIGPDNLAFPAMTDPSHALYQRPFSQCEELSRSAANDEERAYALGCFLHGASDTVAHHFVNYLTGETFTLTPLKTNRESSFDNVLDHIEAEALVQRALLHARPTAFGPDQLTYSVPESFVKRNYFDTKSALYPLFAGHAESKLRSIMTADPGKSFLGAAAVSDLGPAEHLSLVARYLEEIDALRASTRKGIEDDIKNLQNHATSDGSTLRVTAGTDGILGTKDDETACAAACPALYARYFVSVGLLMPRKDAGNNPLPSAFDKVSEKLGQDLREFVPAYLRTSDLISVKFNSPRTVETEDVPDIRADEVSTLFQPMTDWGTGLTAIDYRTLSQAVVPGWITAIENALPPGVNVSVPDIVAGLLSPIVDPIRDGIKERVVDEAKRYVTEWVTAQTVEGPIARARYESVIAGAVAKGQSGTMLDRILDSGLYAHAFNIVVATLGNHAVVLGSDSRDAPADAPASFDTSYSPAWSQAGLCDYLRDAVFPFGLTAQGLFSIVDLKPTAHARMANISADSPVECHGGSLSNFASNPSKAQCALTNMEALKASKTGSLSRGFPPTLGAASVQCRNIVVPGLPPPPNSEPDAGSTGLKPGPTGASQSPPTDEIDAQDPGPCECGISRTAASGFGGSAIFAMALAMLARRSRRNGVQ